MACWSKIKRLCFILFLGLVSGASAGGERLERASVLVALQRLRGLPTGARIVGKMLSAWGLKKLEDIADKVSLGAHSRTDTTLTRTFNLDTGIEEREREILISIRSNQSLEDQVLDLAHELVHASAKPVFDPYDPSLTAGKYILSGIEGLGGEIDAVEEECLAAGEMAALGVSADRCRRYFWENPTAVGVHQQLEESSRMRIKKGFYQVGQWLDQLEKELGSERELFPLLSSRPAELLSSTGRSPYPVALLGEYRAITKIACENMVRRLRSVAKENSVLSIERSLGRIFEFSPRHSRDSLSKDYSKEYSTEAEKFLENRCQSR